MNKIVIVDGEVVESVLDNAVKLTVSHKEKLKDIPLVNINIQSNTDLKVEYECKKTTKAEVFVNVPANTKCNLYEYKHGTLCKVSYKYYLAENSHLVIREVNDLDEVNEMPIINLNGENANITYYLKTVCTDREKYDILVYHNAKNTVSHLFNEGVNIRSGVLKFDVSGFIPKGVKNCDLNQSNRIINLTNNVCEIRPNLFIDENDVIANHSAHIGECDADKLFYLMSRGLPLKKAQTLLIKGFLLNNADIMKKNIEKIINKYWR